MQLNQTIRTALRATTHSSLARVPPVACPCRAECSSGQQLPCLHPQELRAAVGPAGRHDGVYFFIVYLIVASSR